MQKKRKSRRDFLKTSAVAGTSAVVMGSYSPVHAAGSDMFKLGLIGCGGRGRGAVINAITAMPNVKLWAMGELFKDRGLSARESLVAGAPEGRVDVADSRLFSGFDNYKGVIEESDIVLIACASRFHPYYTKAAVEAKKHVFCEKPHGLDADGVHVTLEAAEIAKKNGTALVSGLCFRYDQMRKMAIDQIKAGLIGDITAVQSDYVRTVYSMIKREPSWSELEYQFRNWYHFTWLSGDEILQSLLHNIDSVLWALNEEMPESCYGVGGRSATFRYEFGDMFDHSAVIYEYPDGKRIYGMTRGTEKTYMSNMDLFHGTKGRCFFRSVKEPYITDLSGKEIWRADKSKVTRGMYVNEHYELINSVMNGKPINDGERMAKTTMAAILGTIAFRTGQKVSYKDAFESRYKFQPTIDGISFDTKPAFGPRPDGLYDVAVPGTTKDF